MIHIVGAGPAGSYSAYLLAKLGHKTTLYEENKRPGTPVQCTGIVTTSIEKILRLNKSSVLNRISKVRIHSPEGSSVSLNLKNQNLILDRSKFDENLADMAEKEGTKLILGKKWKKNTTNLKKEDYLIGADGPKSDVAKSYGLYGKRKFWMGTQATVKIKNDNTVEFYPYLGTIAWLVPVNEETARIGVMARNNPAPILKHLMKKIAPNAKTISRQGGLIPEYLPSLKTQKKNIFLIGDAATQVKATTGGGIIQSLRAAICLANSIKNKTSYQKAWKKELGLDLWIHLKIRNLLDKFKEKDYNQLINTFNKERNKKVIEKFDRDYPSSFILKLLLGEPSLIKYPFYILRK